MAKDNTEIEIELKIRLPKDDLEKVFGKLSNKAMQNKIKHKYRPRNYFDTIDLKLFKSNIGLRVQYKEGKGKFLGGFEQTVKHAAGLENISIGSKNDKALSRKECKDMINSETPEIDKVSNPEAQEILKGIKSKK